MNNREDDNRPDDEVNVANTDSDNGVELYEPLAGTEKNDLAMSDQVGLEASSSTNEDEGDLYAATEDDTNPEASESGKDWLVDTGLAAAIGPQAEEDGQQSDDGDMEPEDIANGEGGIEAEDDDSLWSDDEDEDDGEENGDADYDEDLTSSDDDDDFEDHERTSETMPPPLAERRSAWPMLVGGVAVMLLGFGGWDLYQERSALQALVVELERNQSRAKQAVEMDAKTLAALEADNAALTLELDKLYLDYDMAMAELAKVQSDAGQMADRRGDSAANPGDVATSPAPRTAAVNGSDETDPVELESLSPASATSISNETTAGTPEEWFVNVGAYSSAQSAENWSKRLQNSGYDVVIQDVPTAEGKTLKRVRLTGFDSKATAQSVATGLEADYGTGPLWVGQVRE